MPIKKILLVFVFLLGINAPLFAQVQEDGWYQEFDEFGKVSRKVYYKDGFLNGPFWTYYKNGKVKGEGLYINGKQEGKSVGYYANGRKQIEAQYHNGAFEGMVRLFIQTAA